ncbi:conserved hypothetical protein [Gammaproteobacteria bacterium]
MSHDIAKADLLRELGYGVSVEEIDHLLVEGGLSTSGKSRILREKVPFLESFLQERLLRACARSDCQTRGQERAAMEGKRAVPATAPEHCEVCHGSATHLAVEGMVAACLAAGWRRLCIVGGSPAARGRLRDEVGNRLDLRLVDGTVARTRQKAATDISWADHIVAWGATPLDHKVSLLYTTAATCSTVNRRSIEDLARHVTEQTQRARPIIHQRAR